MPFGNCPVSNISILAVLADRDYTGAVTVSPEEAISILAVLADRDSIGK